MADGGGHLEPLPRRLLAGNDDVDVVAAAQAVIDDREQRIGVRWQVDADDVGFLVRHVVDEAGILVGKAVVVLAPDMRSQQVGQRGHGLRQGISCDTFSHLACWLNMESMMWMKAS